MGHLMMPNAPVELQLDVEEPVNRRRPAWDRRGTCRMTWACPQSGPIDSWPHGRPARVPNKCPEAPDPVRPLSVLTCHFDTTSPALPTSSQWTTTPLSAPSRRRRAKNRSGIKSEPTIPHRRSRPIATVRSPSAYLVCPRRYSRSRPPEGHLPCVSATDPPRALTQA